MPALNDGRRKVNADVVCDWFACLPADARDGVLMTLRAIDRLRSSDERSKSAKPEPASAETLED